MWKINWKHFYSDENQGNNFIISYFLMFFNVKCNVSHPRHSAVLFNTEKCGGWGYLSLIEDHADEKWMWKINWKHFYSDENQGNNFIISYFLMFFNVKCNVSHPRHSAVLFNTEKCGGWGYHLTDWTQAICKFINVQT